MALPATNISLNAVNENLGNTATANITLNNSRVRSLTGSSAASGSTFNMSSLSNQSGTWFKYFPVPNDYDWYRLLSYSNNDKFSVFSFQPTFNVDATNAGIGRLDSYLNASEKVNYVYTVNVAENYRTYFIDVAANSSASTLYYTTRYYGEFGYINGFLKTTTSGSIVAAKYFATYVINQSLGLDSSENLYFNLVAPTAVGGFNYGVGSVNSNLDWRWGRRFQEGAPNFNGFEIAVSGVMSSGNICASVKEQITESQWDFRYMQLNPANGDIVGINSYYITNYQSVGIASSNTSGQTILFMSPNTLGYPPAVVLFNGDRTINAVRTVSFNGTNSLYVNSYKILDDGTVYLVGNCFGGGSTGIPFGQNPLFIIKMTFSGTILWVRGIQYSFSGPSGTTVGAVQGRSNIEVTGDNQGIVSIGITAGTTNEYGEVVGNPVLLNIRADGSGTGTYSGEGRTFNYFVETRITMSTTGYSNSGISRTWTYFSEQFPQSAAMTSQPPVPAPTFTINI